MWPEGREFDMLVLKHAVFVKNIGILWVVTPSMVFVFHNLPSSSLLALFLHHLQTLHSPTIQPLLSPPAQAQLYPALICCLLAGLSFLVSIPYVTLNFCFIHLIHLSFPMPFALKA